MYRYFGDQRAYDVLNTVAFYIMALSNFFYFKSKKNAMSLFSEGLIHLSSTAHKSLGDVVRVFSFVVETLFATQIVYYGTQFNRTLGNAFQTGANYFAVLAATPIFLTLLSLILFINPVKELDIITMSLPVFLFFVKLACFFNGCCWGIPWENGLYNYHPNHPGRQVPAQLIEAIFALLILFFLLWYRKKAKPGTIYPMYMITYSATRFFVEFVKAPHPKVLGPLNMYHLMCMTGIIIGLLLLLVVKLYGDTIYTFFEKPHITLKAKITQREEKIAIEAIKQKEITDALEKERLEKVKLAREKSKARKKSNGRKK